MSTDVRELLRDAAVRGEERPDFEAVWRTGRRRRWAVRGGTLIAVVLAVVVSVGTVMSMVDTEPPVISSEPDATELVVHVKTGLFEQERTVEADTTDGPVTLTETEMSLVYAITLENTTDRTLGDGGSDEGRLVLVIEPHPVLATLLDDDPFADQPGMFAEVGESGGIIHDGPVLLRPGETGEFRLMFPLRLYDPFDDSDDYAPPPPWTLEAFEMHALDADLVIREGRSEISRIDLRQLAEQHPERVDQDGPGPARSTDSDLPVTELIDSGTQHAWYMTEEGYDARLEGRHDEVCDWAQSLIAGREAPVRWGEQNMEPWETYDHFQAEINRHLTYKADGLPLAIGTVCGVIERQDNDAWWNDPPYLWEDES